MMGQAHDIRLHCATRARTRTVTKNKWTYEGAHEHAHLLVPADLSLSNDVNQTEVAKPE